MSQRKVIKVEPEELNRWNNLFSLYGQKQGLYDKKKISRKTINTILKNGSGEEKLIKKIRSYHNSQQQPAA